MKMADKRLTKQDIVNAVSESAGLSRADATSALDAPAVPVHPEGMPVAAPVPAPRAGIYPARRRGTSGEAASTLAIGVLAHRRLRARRRLREKREGLLRRGRDDGVPLRWITADEFYGRSRKFRDTWSGK